MRTVRPARVANGHRPTTTLREIAQLLYVGDPELSHALAPHGFRIVFYDQASRRHEARSPVVGVQRVSNEHVDALLQPLPEPGLEEPQDVHTLLRSVDRQNTRFKEHPSEVAARRTLQDLGFAVGDLLECAADLSEADRLRPMPAQGGEPRHAPRRHGAPHRG